ncbi:hypothetical protein [Ferrovibrio sp.]|uniref:hypothetical protein n=1 Tax=Ferrovibrio sp. TaxID=1917215 RepID=UPI00312011A4
MIHRRTRPEQDLHRAVWKFLRVAMPDGCMAWHHPAGGLRPSAEAAIMKGLGTVPGLPDFFFCYWSRLYGIELKTARGRLSMDQVAAHQALRNAGCDVEVCRSLEEVEAALRKWRIPLRASLLGRVAA